MKVDEIRPEVIKFAMLMEKVLKENDHKGGWETCDVTYLAYELNEKRNEFDDSLVYNEIAAPHLVIREAIDEANILMMIVDKLGGLGGLG